MSATPLHRSAAAILTLGVLLPVRAAAQESGSGSAHPQPPPEVGAARMTTPIVLDGRLDEAGWKAAAPATDFRQREPREGEPATQRTEVRFLFDDDALYVGARMYDDQGPRGVRTRLVRRDAEVDSDYLNVVFDTYHDHLGYAIFQVNPSGVKGDALSATGGGADSSWDPVWEAATRVDSLGWTAELRIPFSQLRFPQAREHTWGLQIDRQVSRLNERSHWAFWKQTEAGGPSRFGHLAGLEISRRPARAEILPYVVAQSAHLAPGAAGDPFHRGSEQIYRTGVDLKYLLTSNLTLSATLNPDFGQVEVDPAVVNLSAFETFFPERRPFFVEGSGFFGFGPMWCIFCSNVSSLGLFYSRRIGRAPQGASLAREAGDFADIPRNSTILGAAKITGKTRNGWSIAALNALTGREEARVANREGERFRMPVEPLTNYFVTRVKRDLLDGNLVVGGIATSTYRDLATPELADRLSRHAEGLGFDGELWWGERTYHLLASVAFSQTAGDSAALLRAQRSSARYFQRPDRRHGGNGLFSDAYDPGLTHLRGYGLYTRLAKDAGDWRWDAQANLRSPGFEVNDIAFLTRADWVWMNGTVLRQFTRPTRYYRRMNVSVGAQQQFNFDGDLTDRQFHSGLNLQLPNYWDAFGYVIRRPEVFDDRLTRGGPVVRRPGEWLYAARFATDSRKPLQLSLNPGYAVDDLGTREYSASVNLRYRPTSNVSLSVGPSYDLDAWSHQFVTVQADSTAAAFFGNRYVFADLEQKTVSMDTRLNVTFSPTLSLELFAQPFISSGEYSGYKEFVAPRRLATRVFGRDVGVIDSTGNGGDRRYRVDPDGEGPARPFSFRNPDFNYRSLRGNAVLRWEWNPGSTLFLVWTQDRSDRAPFGDLRLGRDRDALFAARPNNTFLIKMNYWLGM